MENSLPEFALNFYSVLRCVTRAQLLPLHLSLARTAWFKPTQLLQPVLPWAHYSCSAAKTLQAALVLEYQDSRDNSQWKENGSDQFLMECMD